MTIYEKNLQTLNKYYPDMNQLITAARRELNSKLEILEEFSVDGERILRIKKDNRLLYLNGKRNTREPAQIWVKSLKTLQRNSPILIMGVGNYTYLEELVMQSEKRLTIIVYEPSLQLFIKFLESTDIERWMEKHLLVFWVDGIEGMEINHMEDIIRKTLTYEMLDYFRYFVVPNYDILFPDEAVSFLKICVDTIDGEVCDYITRKRFMGVTVKNLLSNARYLPHGYKTTQLTEVIPTKRPGIVVAAGPSLNKNICELKKAKGKAFIIAVDTAIKPLLAAGIVPDMFALIDGLKPLDLIKTEGAKNIPLVSTLSASSDVLEFHTGMKFFYNEGYQFAERIFWRSGQMIGDVSCGGSVATSAFSLLYKLGLNPVILVGQDLAYTDNKSHADGTFKEIMDIEDTSRFQMVDGNIEDKVPTRPDFKLYLDWYNKYIKGCKEHDKDFRVINATEGGAKIDGTEIMTLREAIEKECTREVDIQDCFGKLHPMLNEENQKWAIESLKKLPLEFQNLRKIALQIKKLYQKLKKICVRPNIDRKEYLNLLKNLDKQIKKIEKTSAYQLVAISLTEAQVILRNEQYLSEDTMQEEGMEIARKGILYMDNVMQCAKLFSEYAESIFGEWKGETI